ncbi:AarF/ABC1/UbiB kinase family protein [Kiloniella laminariae]|uniref:AarF/ABC1/UbiB kinase family protein n=1 Tax=Kiloniella laminariae TaxID=454162 RepID=A0ABT4LFI5_9PROT|nr:AarF/ABC1/UbiB kinase family protein [Kiloniella laminariae]MCZ4279849.1 AarF/ABC1/UbiB kinase family protein [Kiloniella laminariae]
MINKDAANKTITSKNDLPHKADEGATPGKADSNSQETSKAGKPDTGSIATHRLQRSATIGLTATRVGLRHLGHMGRSKLAQKFAQKRAALSEGTPSNAESQALARRLHEEDIGRTLFKALNQLKGTALKASQILSMEAEILPEGIRKELAKACYQATPLNRALIDKVFRNEFGTGPGEIFARFDKDAFAAASLGQVHKATLPGDEGQASNEGQAVAVKVQYPGIAASIKSDVKVLSGLLSVVAASTSFMPARSVIDPVLEEITLQLQREVDYYQEAENLSRFKSRLKLKQVRIPAVFADYSSERVLTMEDLAGQHLEEWLAGKPSQAEKNHYGQLLYDFFFHSFFDLNHLHADPHPGNFLFMAGGELGVLDFGCIREIDSSFTQKVAGYYQLMIRHHGPQEQQGSSEQQDFAGLKRYYEDFDLIRPDMDDRAFHEILQPELDRIQHWMIAPYQKAEFDFTNWIWPEMTTDTTRKIAPYMKGINRDLLYFDRAYRGLGLMLSRLGAVVKTGNPWHGHQASQ